MDPKCFNTAIYDPVANHYKIEVNSMGHYTITRPVWGKLYLDEDATESRYLQFEDDIEPFRKALKEIPFLPSNKRNWAYTQLINDQFGD